MSSADPASAEEVSVPATSGDPLSDALGVARPAPDACATSAPPAAGGAAAAAHAPAGGAEPPAAAAGAGPAQAQPPTAGAGAVVPATRQPSSALFNDDDAGPDWMEPEAWTQAADFIVQVHKQMPSELLHEAQRGFAVSQQLATAMSHKLDEVVEHLPCVGMRRHAEPAAAPPKPGARADS